jgi:hypothetical protein
MTLTVGTVAYINIRVPGGQAHLSLVSRYKDTRIGIPIRSISWLVRIVLRLLGAGLYVHRHSKYLRSTHEERLISSPPIV